jgi:hypothetical protein
MGATNTNPFLDAFRKGQAGELTEEDFIKMMEFGGKSVGDNIGELKDAGTLSKRQVQAMDRNKAQIKNYEERFVLNERGQLVSREDTERRQQWEQKRQEGLANPPAPGPTPGQRATKGSEAVDALKAKQEGQAAASSELSEASREKQIAADREARPFAAVVEGLTNPRGEDGKQTQESFEQISKGQNSEEFRESGSIEQGATRDGKSFKMVTRKTPYGDITTKVFDSAEDADSVTGMVPSSDGKTAQPISEVTSALAQQNAADAAPSIAETYANASRQQNRGVGGDRNPSTDIIAGLTATADPNIIANPAVNEKSKEELEREKRIKAMTQGLFPSNTRRATAV